MGILRIARALAAILLLPILIPLAVVSGLFHKGRNITPSELANLLRRVADDTINDDWDRFECVPLSDERLESIRLRAFPFCGRPGIVDEKALYALALEAEALPPARI